MADIEVEALVVGAGPTGLAAAIELQRSGIPFRLIDKSERAAQWSQALVVQARTLEQFERYRIADTAVEQGLKLRRAHLRSEGRTIVQLQLDNIPGRYPYVLFLPQSRTEKIMSDHLQNLGGSIERGTELLGAEDRDNSVVARLRLKDGSEQLVESRWLIGCDGARSSVRECLGIPFEGQSVDLHFFLGDLHLEGPDIQEDEIRIYLHGGDIVFVARLGESLHRVIVALHEEVGSQEEKKLTLSDFQIPLDRAGARIKVTGSDWMTPFRVNDRQAKQYRTKSAFLAGDASHIHSPVGGQGMNTGIQDAANLVWKLKAVRDGAPESLLDSYQEERSAVGKRLLAATSFGLKAASSGNPVLERLRDAVLSMATHSRHFQAAAIGFVSETDIGYRNSSIVRDLRGPGTLRAGDRVPNPDFVFPDGHTGRLLDPLGDGKHLVLTTGPDGERVSAVVPRAATVSSNTEELNGLLGLAGPVAAIRPDGYLGFRGDSSQLNELAQYAKSVGIN